MLMNNYVAAGKGSGRSQGIRYIRPQFLSVQSWLNHEGGTVLPLRYHYATGLGTNRYSGIKKEAEDDAKTC
jgi:hypothetical protein